LLFSRYAFSLLPVLPTIRFGSHCLPPRFRYVDLRLDAVAFTFSPFTFAFYVCDVADVHAHAVSHVLILRTLRRYTHLLHLHLFTHIVVTFILLLHSAYIWCRVTLLFAFDIFFTFILFCCCLPIHTHFTFTLFTCFHSSRTFRLLHSVHFTFRPCLLLRTICYIYLLHIYFFTFVGLFLHCSRLHFLTFTTHIHITLTFTFSISTFYVAPHIVTFTSWLFLRFTLPVDLFPICTPGIHVTLLQCSIFPRAATTRLPRYWQRYVARCTFCSGSTFRYVVRSANSYYHILFSTLRFAVHSPHTGYVPLRYVTLYHTLFLRTFTHSYTFGAVIYHTLGYCIILFLFNDIIHL